MAFNGFTPNGIAFLNELSANNNKEWFEKHRSNYEKHLLEPLKQLVKELGIVMKSIDSNIDTTPSINKTISKIFRDTRFSNDKSPFRTDVWLSFKRPNKVWGNVPEFYFYFTPEEYQYGMGFYSATPERMEKIRDYITLFPERFKNIIDSYHTQKTFVLYGAEYKKTVKNDLSEEYQQWFRKKNIYVSTIKKIDDSFFSGSLKTEIEKAFMFNSGLYQFIIESVCQ